MSSPGRAVLSARRLYRNAAFANALVTLPAFVAYRRYVGSFTREPPNYPFLVKIWSGMALLWGVSFYEISRDPVGRYPLVKYSALEKAVTSACVLSAGARREVPRRLVGMVLLTDVVWIPLFVRAQRQLAPLAPK